MVGFSRRGLLLWIGLKRHDDLTLLDSSKDLRTKMEGLNSSLAVFMGGDLVGTGEAGALV